MVGRVGEKRKLLTTLVKFWANLFRFFFNLRKDICEFIE